MRDYVDDLTTLYANSAPVQTMRSCFRGAVMTDDVALVRRIWQLFPMAAWARARKSLVRDMEHAEMRDMLREFESHERLPFAADSDSEASDTSSSSLEAPSIPIGFDELGVASSFSLEAPSIPIGFDELGVVVDVLLNAREYLVRLPRTADTSHATFEVRNVVANVLEALSSFPDVAERTLAMLTSKHGWDSSGVGQFPGHVDAYLLASHMDALSQYLVRSATVSPT
jgi:hypothetical protein